MFFIVRCIFLSVLYQGDSKAAVIQRGVSGIIQSPNFPNNYPNNYHQTWIILAPKLAEKIAIVFNKFDVFKMGAIPCEDFLQIDEVNTNFTMFNRCAEFSDGTRFEASDNKLRLTFKTDNVNNAQGFDISWKVISYKTTRTTTTPTTTITTTRRKTKSTVIPTVTTSTTTTKQPSTTLKIKSSSQSTTKAQTTPTKTTMSKTSKIKLTFQTSTEADTANISSPLIKTNTPKTLEIKSTSRTRKTTSSPLTITTRSKTSVTTHKQSTTPKTDNSPVMTSDFTASLTSSVSSTPQQNNSTRINVYLTGIIIGGICVVEVTMVAVGIIIYRQRRLRSSDEMPRTRNFEENKYTYSPSHVQKRITIGNEGHVYEDIPLDQITEYEMQKIDVQENPYVECPDNVYDKAFNKRPHAKTQEYNTYESTNRLLIYEMAQRNGH